MKCVEFCVFCALACAMLFAVPAHAEAWTDDMSELNGNAYKRYVNLAPVSGSSIPQNVQKSVPGQNGYTFANYASPIAYAEYIVNGADSVTVEILTLRGSFVALAPDTGTHMLGFYRTDNGYLQSQNLVQAQYSRGGGEVYTRVGGEYHSPVGTSAGFEFLEARRNPGDLIDYALNVYAGKSADSLSRVALSSGSGERVAAMEINIPYAYCLERLRYSLPAGAAHVRVEINDMRTVGYQAYPNAPITHVGLPTGMRTILSSVRFEGAGLTLGAAAQASPESDPVNTGSSASPSAQPQSSGSAKPPGSKSSSAGPAAAAAQSAPSAASSKFSGEVTSTTPGKAESASALQKKAAVKETQIALPEAAQSQADAPPGQPQVEVYRIGGQGSVDSGGVKLYIVAVCAVIAVLLLRGQKGRDGQ